MGKIKNMEWENMARVCESQKGAEWENLLSHNRPTRLNIDSPLREAVRTDCFKTSVFYLNRLNRFGQYIFCITFKVGSVLDTGEWRGRAIRGTGGEP